MSQPVSTRLLPIWWFVRLIAGGIGTLLLRAAERHARDAGASELRIGVLAGNHGARTLYLRAGFAPYLEMLSMPLTRIGNTSLLNRRGR